MVALTRTTMNRFIRPTLSMRRLWLEDHQDVWDGLGAWVPRVEEDLYAGWRNVFRLDSPRGDAHRRDLPMFRSGFKKRQLRRRDARAWREGERPPHQVASAATDLCTGQDMFDRRAGAIADGGGKMPFIFDGGCTDGVTLVMRFRTAYVKNRDALLDPEQEPDAGRRAENQAFVDRFHRPMAGLADLVHAGFGKLTAVLDPVAAADGVDPFPAADGGGPGGCRGVYASVRPLPDPHPDGVENAEARYIRALCADIGQINAVSMQTFAIRIDAGRGRSGVHPNQSIHGEWCAVSGPRYHEVRRENEAYEADQRAAAGGENPPQPTPYGEAMAAFAAVRLRTFAPARVLEYCRLALASPHALVVHRELSRLDRKRRRFESGVRRTSWMAKMARRAARRGGERGRAHVAVIGKGGLNAARGHAPVGTKAIMRAFAVYGEIPVLAIDERYTSKLCADCGCKLQRVALGPPRPHHARRIYLVSAMTPDWRGERCRNELCPRRHVWGVWLHDGVSTKNIARKFRADLYGEGWPHPAGGGGQHPVAPAAAPAAGGEE